MSFNMLTFSKTAFFGGPGRIAGDSPDGIATVAGAPAKVPIRVVHRTSNRVVGFTVSDENGNWEVSNLNPDLLYYVIAFDPTEQFNAVVRDRIVPVVP